MLLAVNSGRSQPVRSVLSRRRSMRRLRLASLPCKVAFTRNPSGLRVLQMLATISNPGKAERFRVFYEIPPPTTGGFAWLRPRELTGAGSYQHRGVRRGPQGTERTQRLADTAHQEHASHGRGAERVEGTEEFA